MAKVNLDALIPREAFEVQGQQGQSTGRTSTLSIEDLKRDRFFFSAARKPDFQRETNEWDAQKICEFVESFLEGDLIPAVILWRSASSYTFVIDGSHRLSALAAWINDDYGDGEISKEFYDGIISGEQLEIAEEARKVINKRVGSFKDYQLAVKNPDKVRDEIAKKAKILGTLAIQVQWVEGDSSKAELSFFKINQQASPIDDTELRLLKARKKPNGVAVRAIIRGGKGHKYWSEFSEEKQDQIQCLAKEINDILFNPNFKNPVKTLDLPIGGRNYSSSSLDLVLEFVNIVNGVKSGIKDDLEEDMDGDETIKFLINCKKVAQRINSIHPSSLGLHPIVYFYTREGRHKFGSFYAITALILDFEQRNYFSSFIKVRAEFESILLSYEYFLPQIVRRYRTAVNAYKHIKNYYLKIIQKLLEGNNKDSVIREVMIDKNFSYLKKAIEIDPIDEGDKGRFSRETKSAAFIREALASAPKCKICGGYLHTNSISIDHIKRKSDGGTSNIENAQLTHPYCNSTIKN